MGQEAIKSRLTVWHLQPSWRNDKWRLEGGVADMQAPFPGLFQHCQYCWHCQSYCQATAESTSCRTLQGPQLARLHIDYTLDAGAGVVCRWSIQLNVCRARTFAELATTALMDDDVVDE